jgi:hypothetical protein
MKRKKEVMKRHLLYLSTHEFTFSLFVRMKNWHAEKRREEDEKRQSGNEEKVVPSQSKFSLSQAFV